MNRLVAHMDSGVFVKVIGIGDEGCRVLDAFIDDFRGFRVEDFVVERVSFLAVDHDPRTLLRSKATSTIRFRQKFDTAFQAQVAKELLGETVIFLVFCEKNRADVALAAFVAQRAAKGGCFSLGVSFPDPYAVHPHDSSNHSADSILQESLNAWVRLSAENSPMVVGTGNCNISAEVRETIYTVLCLVGVRNIPGVDLADLLKTSNVPGEVVFGFGQSDANGGAEQAFRNAIGGTFTDASRHLDAKGAMVAIFGAPGVLSMADYEGVSRALKEVLDEECLGSESIGMIFDEKLGNRVQVNVILTGV